MNAEPIEARINAAARIIGDISTGIYRSPANALKELVSNSFDAGATEVMINTDPPSFSTVSCYDNGRGISREQLQTIFNYIGGSDKRSQGETASFARPIIGRIGIGILAMSQISKRFVIISSIKGNDYRIEAEVNIAEFETPESARSNLGSGSIGNYRIYTLPEAPDTQYTIVATPAGSQLLKEFLGNQTSPRNYFVNKNYESGNFRQFVDRVSSARRRPNLSDYDLFLWELAALCPVPYFEGAPIKGWDGWEHVNHKLHNYNFKVIVDGYELRKPIVLPTPSDLHEFGPDYQVYPFDNCNEPDIGLKFSGYIFHQRKQISPSELQGLLIRIRNVGVTGYEKDLLGYPPNLGPMTSGISGEIYVEQGLEDALNIDRNSFNETHEHFIQLRKVLFEHLGVPGKTGITTDIRNRSKLRQQLIREAKSRDQLISLGRRIVRSVGHQWDVDIDDDMDSPVELDIDRKQMKFNLNHETVPKSQSAKNEFFRICTIARLAEKLGPPEGEADALVGWLRKL